MALAAVSEFLNTVHHPLHQLHTYANEAAKSKKSEYKLLLFQSEALIQTTLRRKVLGSIYFKASTSRKECLCLFFSEGSNEEEEEERQKETITMKAFLKSSSFFRVPHSNKKRKAEDCYQRKSQNCILTSLDSIYSFFFFSALFIHGLFTTSLKICYPITSSTNRTFESLTTAPRK